MHELSSKVVGQNVGINKLANGKFNIVQVYFNVMKDL